MAIRFADRVTVVSRELQTYFLQRYRVESTYTPNGVTVGLPGLDLSVLTSFGLEKGEYILFASRLVPEKGAHELIEAFNKIDTDKKLVIAGGSRYDDAYVASLRRADRTGRCVFTGHQSGSCITSLFNGAFLYVLPSHIEGLSLSLLEAVGHGKAVLVSDIPENLEVVGPYGFRYPVGDVRALERELSRLLDSPESVRLAEGEAKRILAHSPTWNTVAGEYRHVFESFAFPRAEPIAIEK